MNLLWDGGVVRLRNFINFAGCPPVLPQLLRPLQLTVMALLYESLAWLVWVKLSRCGLSCRLSFTLSILYASSNKGNFLLEPHQVSHQDRQTRGIFFQSIWNK